MAGKIPAGTFNTRITLDGTQPVQTLTQLRTAVREATTAWRAQSAELRSAGDAVGAAEAKYKGLGEAIDRQKNLLSGLKEEQSRVDRSTASGAQSYSKLEVSINNATRRLNSLTSQQDRAKNSVNYYKSGLASAQSELRKITESSNAYVNRLEAEGKHEEANKARLSGLESAYSKLNESYKIQSRELGRIASEAGKSSEAYRRQKVRVDETATSLAKTKTQMGEVNSEMKKANPSIFDRIKNKLTGVNDEAKHSHSLFKTIFSAQVISNAFTNGISAVWNGFKGMVTSGLQLDEAVEKVNERFKALGKSKSDIHALDNEVTFLRTHAKLTGAEAAQLLQTTNRMAAGNTKQAMALARGIASIGDGAKIGGRQMNQLAAGMTRIIASGKVTAGTFNRISKAAPNLGHALAQAAGVSERKFNEMVQSGKMSSADFMRYVERAGRSGSQSFRDFTKTQEGATWYMSQSWDALKAKLTQPLFNVKTTGMTQLADLMNSKPVQQGTQMLAEGLRQVAKWALQGLGWMANHKKDIVGIGSDFVVIVKDLAIDVWKDFAAILTDIAKGFGLVSINTKATKDPLHDFRNTMDAIAKNPGAIKKIADSLVVIAGLKTLGTVLSPLVQLANMKVGGNTVLGSIVSGKFKNGLSSLMSGGTAAQGAAGAAKSAAAGGAGKVAGSAIFGKLLTGAAAVGVAADAANQLTKAFQSKSIQGKFVHSGEGIGSAIGGAIGAKFGPMGMILGSQLGKVIGGLGGKAAADFNKGWNAHVPPAKKFSLPNLGYSMHQMFNRMGAGFRSGWRSFQKAYGPAFKAFAKSWNSTMKKIQTAMRPFFKWTEKTWDSFEKAVFGKHAKTQSQLEKSYNSHIKKMEKATSKHVKASTKAHATMYGTEEKSQSKHDKKSEKEHGRHIKSVEKADATHRKKHSKNKSSEYKSREKAQSTHYKKSEKAKKNHIAYQEKQDVNHRKKHTKNRSAGYKKREKEQSSHYKKLERAKKKHITKNERSDASHRKKHSRNTSKAYKSLEREESAHYKRSATQRTKYAKEMARLEAKYEKQSPKQWRKQWAQMEREFQKGAKRVEKTYQSFFKQLNKMNKSSLKSSNSAWKRYWNAADKANENGGKQLVRIVRTYTRRAISAWRSYWRTVENGQDAFNRAMEHRRSTWLAEDEHETNSRLVAMEHDWQAYWKTVESTDSAGWKTLLKHEANWSKTMSSRLTSFSKSYQRGFKSLSTGINRIWSHAFTDLRHTTVNGLNGMIGELNRGIDRINGVISAYGGHSRIGHAGRVGYATGTGFMAGMRRPITKPTLAVVNDGNDSPETGNKEAIIRGNSFGIFQGRNVPALLMPGDEILNATETKQLMHASGIEHFASGTGLLGISDWSTSTDEGLKKYYDKAEDIIKHAAEYLKKIFNYSGGALSGAIHEITSGMATDSQGQASDFWQTMWSMASDELDGGDASGLLGAVEKYGHGKPYVWGAAGADAFDCSGLVMYALQKAFHRSFPHYSGAQYQMTVPVSNPQPGDLVFFGPGGSQHVGVYAGGGRYYSAMSPSSGIGMSHVGAGAIYRRIPGLKTSNSSGPKADTAIKKYVKGVVGAGFWKFMEKLGDKFGFGAMDNPGGTGVARWVEVIKAAADKMHVSLTGHDMALIENVISHESRGNPRAVNGWDWNAQQGHPSKGLVQFVQSTFDTYAMPGHNDIFSGYDQLLAMFNDANWRSDLHWGGGWGPSGRRRYANGGLATSASIFGEAGPEMAIPISQVKSARSYELIGKTAALMAQQDDSLGQIKSDNKLLKKVDQLTSAVNLLVASLAEERDVDISMTIDKQKIGEAVVPTVSKAMAHLYNQRRRGFSGR